MFLNTGHYYASGVGPSCNRCSGLPEQSRTPKQTLEEPENKVRVRQDPDLHARVPESFGCNGRVDSLRFFDFFVCGGVEYSGV